MRFRTTRSLIPCLLFALAVPAWSGCQSPGRNQREVALLRAEILDLEDQYYALKSRCEYAESQLGGNHQCDNCAPQDVGEVILDGSEVYYDGENVGDLGEPVGSGFSPIEEPFIHDPSTPSRYLPAAERYLDRLESRRSSTRSNQPPKPRWLENLQGLLGRNQNQTPSAQTSERRPWFIAPPFRPDTQRISPLARLQEQLNSRGSGFDRTESANIELDPDIDVVIPNIDPTPTEANSRQPALVGGNETFEVDPYDLDIQINEPEVDFAINETQVSEIFIAREFTKSRNLDGNPGDEGIELLLQPKTELGDILLKPASTTVRVVDPLESGARQQIGSWKFSSEEISLFQNEDQSNPGYLLHLPWDQRVPRNRNLMILVSYVTPDGRTLQTRQELNITPPGSNQPVDLSLITGWTKRDQSWNQPTQSGREVAGRKPSQPTRSRARSSMPARPASTTIQKPTWRPSR